LEKTLILGMEKTYSRFGENKKWGEAATPQPHATTTLLYKNDYLMREKLRIKVY
jgi:hypothetical protein